MGPGATPAAACSCLAASDEEHFARAHAVFRATVVGVQMTSPGPYRSSADPVTWTFAVSQVLKGDAAPLQPVASVAMGASCGLEIPHEGEFFVFVSRRETGEYAAGLCDGTRSTTEGPLAVASLLPTTTVADVPPTTTAAAPTTTLAPEPAPIPPVATTAPGSTAAELEAATVAADTPVPDADGSGGLPLGPAAVAVAAGGALAAAGIGGLRWRRGHP